MISVADVEPRSDISGRHPASGSGLAKAFASISSASLAGQLDANRYDLMLIGRLSEEQVKPHNAAYFLVTAA